jgi:hypothetical protein
MKHPVHHRIRSETREKSGEQGKIVVQQESGQQESDGEYEADRALAVGDPDIGWMRVMVLMVEPIVPSLRMSVFGVHPEPVQDVFEESPGNESKGYQNGLEKEWRAFLQESEPDELGRDETGEGKETIALANRCFE